MNKVNELESLKNSIRINVQELYKNDYNDIGDFSYGIPIISRSDPKYRLVIGKFCSIATCNIFLGPSFNDMSISTYPFKSFISDYKDEVYRNNKITTIGNDVWLGYNCTILSGVNIGNGAVIGAQAVVSSDIPDYAIVIGNPGTVIKYRFNDNVIKELLKIRWWDWDLQDIANVIQYLICDNSDKLFEYYYKNIKK